jgi:apolipoprotein N-acyltransferase
MGLGREREERRHRALPTLAALVCSAVLFYFGTGLAPVAALTWLAPLPVLLLAPRVSPRVAAGVAFLAFLLGTANSWAFQLRSHDEPMLPIGLMINIGCSLLFALAVWGFRRQLVGGRALLSAITAPALWTGALYLLAVSNPMGLMGTFANDLGNLPLVLQTASVTGIWGVEFLALFVPSTVAALLAPGTRTAARVRTGAVAAAVLAAALGAGAMYLSGMGGTGPVQRVAAIATNQKVWAPDLATSAGRDLVDAYVAEIARLPHGVKTVVLPEQSFGSHDPRPATLIEPMSRLAQSRGIDIVVGLAHWDGNSKYNYALTFLASGGEPVAYLKHHDRVSPPGHDLVFPPVAGARAGVEICGDINLTRPTRDYAAAGTKLLLVPASDENDNGWQHSRMMLLRGAEHGQATVWSARTGTLMIADGHGSVLADAHTGGRGSFTTVVADVPTGPGATPYTRLGDWFAWLCLALAVGGLIMRNSAPPAAEPDGHRAATAFHTGTASLEDPTLRTSEKSLPEPAEYEHKQRLP